MSDTIPVPGFLLRRLWLALGGGVLFLSIATIQGLLRDGYDPLHQAVSALSLGPGGWLQMINFVAFGLIVASTVPVWRRILAGGKGETVYPALTAVLGGSLIAVGVIPQDPAPGYDPAGLALEAPTTLGLVHLAIAGIAALCSVACLGVIATRFTGHPSWRGWPAYSRAAAVVLIACVAVFGVWSTRASGLAGTFERMAIAIPMLWMFTFLRRLDTGIPFMSAPRRLARGADARSPATTFDAPARGAPPSCSR